MSKKNIVSNILTIDTKHDEMLERFENIETTIIPNLDNEKNSLINEAKKLTKKQVDRYMDIKDRIKEINKSIKNFRKEKNDYFIENSSHIFKYFEDKKKNIIR